MGHQGHLKNEYRSLVDRLAKGPVALPEPEQERAWEGWREILEILYTPEEAALAARLPVAPTGLRTLSRNLGLPEDELQRRLEPMCDKGVVMDLVNPKTGRVKYMLSPPVVGFFEFSMMRIGDGGVPRKRMAEALHAYTHGDETFAREVFAKDTVVGRAMAHETALDGDSVPDVLDWERSTRLLETARSISVSTCYCRHKAEHLGTKCDAPTDVCLSLNGAAEFVVRRRLGRPIERKDALATLERARAQGLVQIADNVQHQPAYLCNCCGCCCGQLQAINEYGLRAVNPSGFVPVSDEEKCKGCSRCARACPVTALSMVGRRQAATRKNELAPRLDEERCIGCGVCVGACKSGALRLHRKARPQVPRDAVERTLHQALERGRLAHLVFDDNVHPHLNRLLRGITALPATQLRQASRQLRSRFVSALAARAGGRAG